MWLNRATIAFRAVPGLYWDFRLETPHDPIPMNTPLILAPNHTSFLDPWFLSWIFPRAMHHLINREWFEKSTAWNLFFRSNGTIPVSPNDPEGTMKSVQTVLDKGRAICIFPEGKISPDGTLQRFRPGISWFAAMSGVPVLPVGLLGAREALPRGKKIPNRGTIVLRAGSSMTFPSPGPNPPRREMVAFVKELHSRVDALCQEGANRSLL